MMIIKSMSKDEIEYVYNSYLVNDFDSDEVKPLDSIIYSYNKKMYKCYKALVNGSIIGYAFFYINKGDILLDYFSIIKQFRFKGYGSEFIRRIIQKISKKCLYVEVEDPEYSSNAIKRESMNKRIEFYSKNGLYLSDVKTYLFNVNYRIMTSLKLSDELILKGFTSIYKSMVSSKDFDEYVKVYYGN